MVPRGERSPKRTSVDAITSEPFCLKPVAWPVLFPSDFSRSNRGFARSVKVRAARS
jgi:hypothetical protein